MSLIRKFLLTPSNLLIVWTLVALVGALSKLGVGPGGYNNFMIFRGVARHLFSLQPLYASYPTEHHDINHYGPLFGLIVAPFAWLPAWLAVPLWVCGMSLALFWAIRNLPVETRWQCIVLWIAANDLYCAVILQQFNIAVAALLVGCFVMIEKGREGWAALFIVVGTFVKIYGIVGLALFFFVRRKGRFVFLMALWSAVALLLPLLFVPAGYLIEQYRTWITDIAAKNTENMFAYVQNISIVGVVRKISGSASYSDLWLIVPALLLFLTTYLRRSQYRCLNFRLTMLASLMIFIVIFSSGSENSGYIIATTGVGIWWTALGRRGPLAWTLLGLVMIASFARMLFPGDFYHDYVFKYALRSVPYFLVWLHTLWLMWTADFAIGKPEPEPDHSRTDIDIVLPCYNPEDNWVETVARHFAELRRICPEHRLRLFVSNDGSKRNFDQEHIASLKEAVPDAVVVDNPVNRGKGATLRTAIAQTTAPLVVYTDIDFPYRTECIRDLIGKLASNSCDIAVATRNHTYYNELTFRRRLLSWSSKGLNLIVLGITCPDAQGGLKGFNDKGRQIFLQTKIDRFLFDTEFVAKVSRARHLRIGQIEASLRPGVVLPPISRATVRHEALNFVKLVFRT